MMTRRFASMIAVCILLLLAVAPSCMAAPQIGVRMLSMAGAGVALADDGTAPRMNPAGVTLVESTFTFDASSDPTILQYLPALFRIASGNPTIEDCETILARGLYNPTAGLFASYCNKWYGVSLLAYGESNADCPAALAVTLTGAYQIEGALGARFLSVGANAHLFKGVIATGSYDTATQLMMTDVTSVNGYALDVGLLLKANDRLSIGLVGRNLWYAYQGLRTYRVTDMSNGDIIAENVAPVRFDWDDLNDYVPGDDNLLFRNDPYEIAPRPERITVDFGVAFKPFKSENITMAFDVQGIQFGYEYQWAILSFSSLNIGYEHVLGPFTLRLGAALPDSAGSLDIEFGGGLAYRTNAHTFGAGINWRAATGWNTQAGFAWRW